MTAIAITPAARTPNLHAVAEQFTAEHETKLAALTNRIETYKKAKVDAVADTRAFSMIVEKPSNENLPAQLVMTVPSKGIKMLVGDVAHQQLQSRLDIRHEYYKKMNAEALDLLALNVNYWLAKNPEDRLFRMLRVAALDEKQQQIAGSVGAQLFLRGVLGKGYRTIDDADLVHELLPVLASKGALLRDFSIDERRMHARFATVARSVQEVITQLRETRNFKGNNHAGVDEIVSSGITIRHSEVGFASLSASMYDELLRCINGYVSHNEISIRHVGGKNGKTESDDDVRYLSDSTQIMENAALLGRVRDRVDGAFELENIANRTIKFLEAKTNVVDTREPLFEFVGNLGAGLDLTQDQTELLKQETYKAITEEGGQTALGQPTQFAIVQGITALARQLTDYDRRVELERSGFQYLNDDPSALLKLARDGAAGKRKGSTN